MVSDQWREMSPEDKEQWEEMARQDKARYLRQKEEYAGPWKVPADMKRPKDPTAPKKPTPAYFSFSNERRQAVKKENPMASNGEISKILSGMWRDADEKTRAVYVAKEKEERKIYNTAVDDWKKERKESGRENWWDHDSGGREDGSVDRKRARLDVLADAAPQPQMLLEAGGQHRNMLGDPPQFDQIASSLPGGASMTPLNAHYGGGVSSSLHSQSSLQDQLNALSSQGGLQAIAALLPGLLAGQQGGVLNANSNSSSSGLPELSQPNDGSSLRVGGTNIYSNYMGQEVLDTLQRIMELQQQQHQPSSSASGNHGSMDRSQTGGSSPYSTLFSGAATSSGGGGGSTSFANLLARTGGGDQQSLLATLLGGGATGTTHPSQQHQEQQSYLQQNRDNTFAATQGAAIPKNVGDILSLLYRGQQQQSQKQHAQHRTPPPPQQQHHQQQQLSDLQSLLLGLPGNLLLQLQQPSLSSSETGQQHDAFNAKSALAALLGGGQQASGATSLPQTQHHSSSQMSSGGGDHLLVNSLLQSLLQQSGNASNPTAQAFMSQQPQATPPNSLEEALSRLVRQSQGHQQQYFHKPDFSHEREQREKR